MNGIKKDNTEKKILNAAKTIFIKKGMDGARMQEIADEAGINKALLHYYFRNKQKLFEAIFTNLFKQIIPNVITLVDSNKPINIKLSDFIENYMEVILNNPYLPAFVIKEINRDPEFFGSIFTSFGIKPMLIFEMFEKEMDAGNIIRMNPKEVMINILSLCLFPFAASPLIQLLTSNNNDQEYRQLLEERKKTIKDFVLNAILTEQIKNKI